MNYSQIISPVPLCLEKLGVMTLPAPMGAPRPWWQYVKPFSSDTVTSQTDRRTDRQTDLLYQYRASVCWRAIKTIFVMQNLGDLGTNWDRGSKFLVENVIFRIAHPDLPIHYATFWGYTIMVKGSLLLSTPNVKHFRSKKSPFLAKILRFSRINRGLTLNLSFITPKRHVLA